MCRMIRIFVDQAESKPTSWFRSELEKMPLSKSAMEKLDFEDKHYAGVPCMIVTPAATKEQLISVYIHGGGYISGSPKSATNFASALAKAIQTTLVVPDYRLSPEHVFPAAQDDCLQVVEALIAKYPLAKISLIGDSAGAALAITTALSINSSSKIDSLVLLSPWVDPTASSGSIVANDGHDIFGKAFLDQSYAAHIGDADPLNTRSNFVNADLSGLPRTYIQAGGVELLIDQITEFAQRAVAQGVDVECDSYEDMFHVFQVISPDFDESKAAIKKIAAYIG